tara:strand:- start:60321 stop:60857 length:537 start_codon:yes stop_codon:yes gene_type:complete
MSQQPKILLAGTPQLRAPSKRVTSVNFHTAALSDLIDLLFQTMEQKNGVGLAAIQIGVPLRVIVYGFDQNPRYPSEAPIPKTVILNPEIVKKSETLINAYEGCLSLPTVRGQVPRHDWIEIQGLDHDGQLIHKKVTGFEARIIQHEIDHTHGLIFPDKMTDMKTLGITSALQEAGIIA